MIIIIIITMSEFQGLVKPLLENFGLRSVSKLYKNELRLIAFRTLNDLTPNCHRQLLIQNSQQPCTALRNIDRDLEFPLKNPRKWSKGYLFRGAKSWNGLSASAKRAPALASLKSHL